jgi:hypothetical protein
VAGDGHDPGVDNDHTHDSLADDGADPSPSSTGPDSDRYVELEDGSQHRIWAASDHLRAMESRFDAADAWLAERGLSRADVQPLLVQPADWLNATQRELVYEFRHQFPEVASGEPLQKVIPTWQAESRLAEGEKQYAPDQTGGSVSVARDTLQLNSPERIYDGLALEYDATPFAPDQPVVAMRFTVEGDVSVHLPDHQLSNLTGHGDSYNPGYEYPFTGTGFTASDHFTVPEYFLGGGTEMNDGAEMYRINPDGSQELLAVLKPDGEWIRVRSDG